MELLVLPEFVVCMNGTIYSKLVVLAFGLLPAVFTGRCATTDIGFDDGKLDSNLIVIGRVLRYDVEQPGKWILLRGTLSGRTCEFFAGKDGLLYLETPYTGLVELEMEPAFVEASPQPLHFRIVCRNVGGAQVNVGGYVLGQAVGELKPGVVYVLEGRRFFFRTKDDLVPQRVEIDDSKAMTDGIIAEFQKRNPEMAKDVEFRVLKLEGEKIIPGRRLR